MNIAEELKIKYLKSLPKCKIWCVSEGKQGNIKFSNDNVMKLFVEHITGKRKSVRSDYKNTLEYYYSIRKDDDIFFIGFSNFKFWEDYEKEILYIHKKKKKRFHFLYKKENKFLYKKKKKSILSINNVKDIEYLKNVGFDVKKYEESYIYEKIFYYIGFNDLIQVITENEYLDLKQKTLEAVSLKDLKKLKTY